MNWKNPVNARLHLLAEPALYGHRPEESDYEHSIAWDGPGNQVIREALSAGDPCLVTRLGSVELNTMSFYLRWRRRSLIRPGYPSVQTKAMRTNAGFFPLDEDSLDRFAETMLEAVSHADVLGVWFNRGESRVVKEYCPSASLVELAAMNCMCYEHPWSAELAGKTVLVIHPFARSIEAQYHEHRAALFSDPEVLPEFKLRTLIPVQSIAGNDCGYASWFDALYDMCEQIRGMEFDVAIIGAGAYGLPLGAFVKGMGRQAIHMGGATQLLFGIKGRRWEEQYQDVIVPLFNDAWVRPLPEEKPAGAEGVERGCYW